MNSVATAREIAARCVLKVSEDKAYSNLVLNSALKNSDLSADDKALCTTLFYGTLDRMVTIDFFLKKLIKTKLSKISPYTLCVLRTAVFQIKYLEKVPHSAAVNEAVNLVKNSDEAYNSNFTNAVLRNLLRTEITLPSGNSIYDISVSCSAPEWIVSMLIPSYGAEFTRAFLKESLLPPPTYIRVNTQKTDTTTLKNLLACENVEVKDTLLPDALVIKGAAIEQLESYKKGLFFVQDISCQMAVKMLNLNESDRLLDICAAPGGKSFCAAMSGCEVVACDLYEHRTGLIDSGASRLGLTKVSTKTADATAFSQEFGLFSAAICDVPCSGIGVIRRKPDIKYNKTEDFAGLISTQRSILDNADKYLSKGGKLLYSTCTLNIAENRENVDFFLSQHPNYILAQEHTFSPQNENSDGFYAALLIKN